MTPLSKHIDHDCWYISTSDDKKSIKVSLDIIMKDDLDQNTLTEEISSINGLSEVVIIAAKTDIDY